MSDGQRDAFIENDVIGNYNTGTDLLGAFSDRKPRRARKKHRKKSVHKRNSRKHKRRRRVSKVRKSRGGIKYTKNGQPYKIMPNGRARFLKKRGK